jgi:hypothetical protein
MDALLKQLLNARYQLTESREDGTLHEYIDDQHKDLEQVLSNAIRLLSAQNASNAA